MHTVPLIHYCYQDFLFPQVLLVSVTVHTIQVLASSLLRKIYTAEGSWCSRMGRIEPDFVVCVQRSRLSSLSHLNTVSRRVTA